MTANIHDPEWDAETDRAPYRWRRSLLGRRAGAERLGASLFDVPPGGSTFPFHAHHANEELLVVVRGTPTLRTLAGERVLAEGEYYRVGGHAPLRASVRIIAATHQNLEERVRQGLFREDLMHRLNVVRLRLPPLRERPDELFIDTVERLGVEPFKERVYAAR